MKTIRLSIIGFGAVGQGVARSILSKQGYINKQGINLCVVGIADSGGCEIDDKGIDLMGAITRKKQTGTVATCAESAFDLISNVEHEIIVEATPTNIKDGEPGLNNMLTALNSGKNVVTSNKGPLALRFSDLKEMAEDNGLFFRYESTVGGAVPIFNLVHEAMAGNTVIGIEGILNGTCNYILTRMAEERLPYELVLKEAQELGIAETDPTYDVEGIDSACKLVIIANSIFQDAVTYRDVDITGITKITPEALELASKNNYVVKLICEAGNGTLTVAPRLVPKRHPLAVGGTLNVASILTDLAGRITISGKGAGSIETASSILSDVLHIARNS
ncbi:homoserine dehydrogenase [Candidatus Methanoperedens nitroreducens]|uniref:Homoserine dehydrogenase n=1 Tax=Candidatus Methanoperedens nitratireducens TaxID=1392998 RepID=A0A062V4S5_9EURY|nr:homoserine dehydrogenase [Candidatus Methanoperedens nitroreducens]KCZ72332.1 homoserine dehydrogenase [Candidatus Methanoperedens nitroreducens]MDJ1423734.1 homoserine dehydrogenase [Candidatus Methanoperedens sp.]